MPPKKSTSLGPPISNENKHASYLGRSFARRSLAMLLVSMYFYSMTVS